MNAIKTRAILLLILLISSVHLYAQQNDELKKYGTAQLKRMGSYAAKINDFSSSAMYYEEYCKRKPTNEKVWFLYAESLRKSKDYRKAEDAYMKAYNLNPKLNALALYHYANVQKSLGNYKKAEEYFTKFKKEYKQISL